MGGSPGCDWAVDLIVSVPLLTRLIEKRSAVPIRDGVRVGEKGLGGDGEVGRREDVRED